MNTYNLGFIGFGNVGRALARLLAAKATELRDVYDIECHITGVASRSLGWLVTADGLTTMDPAQLRNDASRADGLGEWLNQAQPDVVFQDTSLNHETGQPAIEYLSAALKSDAHAITANKGAVVYGYEELSKLAHAAETFLFRSYRVGQRAGLLALSRNSPRGKTARLHRRLQFDVKRCVGIDGGWTFFRRRGEGGSRVRNCRSRSFARRRRLGSTVKICALANVLMGMPDAG